MIKKEKIFDCDPKHKIVNDWGVLHGVPIAIGIFHFFHDTETQLIEFFKIERTGVIMKMTFASNFVSLQILIQDFF